MSKAKFEAVKELIQAKQYAEARAILKTIDHPTARQWEAKLNTIASAAQPIQPKRKWTPKKVLLLAVLAIPTTCILLAVLTALTGNSQRQAVSQSAAEMSAGMTQNCDAAFYMDGFKRSACQQAAKDFETCSNRGGTYDFMTLCLSQHQTMICSIIYGADKAGLDRCVAEGNETPPAPAS
ncbi:MAG: hypothetical protein LCI00_05620 [Chloroflexi bacterium]|nr:hypothetical protein [Chloroflexota bacterium]